MKKLFLLGFTASLLAVSCTVQKRLHNPGYHVTWKSRYKSVDKNDLMTKETISDEKVNSEDLAIVENAKEIENEPFVIINSENSNDSFSYTTTENKTKSNTNNTVKSLKSGNEKSSMSKFMAIKKLAKKATKSSNSDDDLLLILLVILCFLIPPLAVAIASDWDLIKILISLILTILFWFPGIIYALYIVLKDRI